MSTTTEVRDTPAPRVRPRRPRLRIEPGSEHEARCFTPNGALQCRRCKTRDGVASRNGLCAECRAWAE